MKPLQWLRGFAYRGNNRFCCVCNRSARAFLSTGINRRRDARCPFCNSLERDRLTIAFLRSRTDLFDGTAKRMLHVAAENCLTRLFADACGPGYLSADLKSKHAMVRMDITEIEYPDGRFDVIYCSHVLEHIPDDRAAIGELFRVLRPGGWAVLNVPVTSEETFEDPSVTTPEERLRVFGQEDHVRLYGADYSERLEAAGFQVQVARAADFLSDTELVRQGMTNAATGEVHYGVKLAAGEPS